jgi:hypothetical protein
MGLRWRVVLILVSLTALLHGCLWPQDRAPNTLSYNLPATLSVPLGEALPGTDVVYSEYTEQGARFLVKGQTALKRTGDSVEWRGTQAPGADVELKLRLVHANASAARLAGTAELLLQDVAPAVGAPNTAASVHYTGPVTYTVNRSETLPGTNLTYEGMTDDGAQLGGLLEYPYRRSGDSIFWEGRLNEHASLRLDVRVVLFTDHSLHVAGLATVWLY